MTHVKALQPGHSSQGTSEPITPGLIKLEGLFKLEGIFKLEGSGTEMFCLSSKTYLLQTDSG